MKGKKFTALMLVFVMAVTMMPLSVSAVFPDPVGGDVNLLMNGSFDDPDLFDYYWWLEADPYRGGTCEYQPSGGVDDSGCVKMTGAAPASIAALFYNDQISGLNPVRVVPGRTYRASVDVFRPAGVTAAIRLDAENAGSFYAVTTQAGLGRWEHLSYDITVPVGIDLLWMHCFDVNKELLPSQYVLIDNFSLVCLTDAQAPGYIVPSGNLVRNGDFANEAYTALDYHAEYGGVDISRLPSGGTDNSACLEMRVNGAGENGCVMYRRGNDPANRLRLTEGNWYSVSVDVFREQGLNKQLLMDGENYQAPSAAATENGKWEHLHYTFKAAATDSGYYDLRILLEDIRDCAGKTVRIDNLRVICLSEAVDPGFEPVGPDDGLVNLYWNGSFDDPDMFDYYWWNDADPYRGGTCVYQPAGGVDGSGCVKMGGAGSNAVACLSYLNQITEGQTFAFVAAGRTYTFSVDVFRPAGVTANIRIDGENFQENYAETTPSGIGKWEHLSYSFTVPAGRSGDFYARCMNLDKALLPGQYVLIDNYSLICLTDEQAPGYILPSENLMRNGDFANEAYTLLDYHAEYGGIGIKWLAEGGRDNSACLEMKVNGADVNGCVMYRRGNDWSNRFKPIAGYWYSVSVDVFREQGLDKKLTVDGENWQTPNAVAKKNGEWEHLHYTFKAGETNNGYYDFRILLEDIQGYAGKTVKVDNLRVICLSEAVDPGFGPISPDDCPDNLLMNGSFDDPDLFDRYWWIGTEPYRGSTCAYLYDGGVDNSGCVKMTGAAPNGMASLFYQNEVSGGPACARVVPGRTYRASVDVFRPVGVTATICYNVENAPTSYAVTTGVGRGEWEHLSFDIIVPAGMEGLWLHCFDLDTALLSNQYVLIDNYSLICLSDAQAPVWSAPSENLVRNGDFANESHCFFDYYAGYDGVDLAWLPNGGVDNSACLEMTVNGTAQNGCFMYRRNGNWDNRFKPIEGYWYAVSADVFREAGFNKTVRLDGENYQNPYAAATKNGEWEHLHYTFKAGATNSGYYDLRIVLENIPGDAGKTVRIDNLRVICLSETLDPGFEPLAADVWGRTLVRSGNFNAEGYALQDWFARADYGGMSVSHSADGGVGSTGCLALTTDGKSDVSCLTYHLQGEDTWGVRVDGGNFYLLECDVCRTAGSDMRIHLGVDGNRDAEMHLASGVTAPAGEWVHLRYCYYCPEDTDLIPCLYLEGTAMSAGKTVLVDNFAVRELNGKADFSAECGDVTGNGRIDIADVTRLKKYLASRNPKTGISSTEMIIDAGDCTDDGQIGIGDVIRLKKYLASRNPKTGISAVMLGFKHNEHTERRDAMYNGAVLSASDAAPYLSEFEAAGDWLDTYLLQSGTGKLAFDFKMGDTAFSSVIGSWSRTAVKTADTAEKTEYTLTWQKAGQPLKVTVYATVYKNYPVVEYTPWIENIGSANSAVISEFYALDGAFSLAGSDRMSLTDYEGSTATVTAFEPRTRMMREGDIYLLGGQGGKPTETQMSYFNTLWQNKAAAGGTSGVFFSVGWPGQWKAEVRNTGASFTVKAGQEHLQTYLMPGEKIRSAMMTMLFWEKADVRAQNLWRRFVYTEEQVQPGGEPVKPLISANTGTYTELTETATTANQLEAIRKWRQLGLNFTHWQMDAGWYPLPEGYDRWVGTGNWVPDPARFENSSLKAISDELHAGGQKLILWFEPERVVWNSDWAELSDSWLIKRPYNYCLNFANDDAVNFLIDYILTFMANNGVDVYRQDCNFNASEAILNYWKDCNTPNRVGITENRYLVNYLRYYDAILAEHPDSFIDSCASGGRRMDLETVRRSVALWRDDLCYDNTACQCQSYGLNFLMPYSGQGSVNYDTYSTRSTLMAAGCLPMDLRNAADTSAITLALKRTISEWTAYQPYTTKDYYPLSAYSTEKTAWMAWQYHDPDAGSGIVQIFRREQGLGSKRTYYLNALDPDQSYTLKDADNGMMGIFTGRQLMEEGLTVTIPTAASARIILYTPNK